MNILIEIKVREQCAERGWNLVSEYASIYHFGHVIESGWS